MRFCHCADADELLPRERDPESKIRRAPLRWL
jgi:hypothetical protein